MIIKYFIIFFTIFLIIELVLHFLFSKLRVRFKNVIITKKDELPEIDKNNLDKFLEIGYDSELGWIRKPNTFKIEETIDGNKSYTINSIGSRTNPNHEHLPLKIVSFGDSYTFCREVDDNQTWQYYLAELANCNVANFGVGNYGLDQAFLRFKKELPKIKEAKIVLVGVVPETIQRNLSIWKHYSEFGNIFGFKPRFILKNDKLELIPNVVNEPSKFLELKKIIPIIHKYDYFYKKKFKKDLFSFPYLFSILKNPKKKIPFFICYSGAYFLELLHIDWKKIKILPSNQARKAVSFILKDKISYYQNQELVELTLKILKEFHYLAKKQNLNLIFIMLPRQEDIEYIKKTQDVYYKQFLDKVKEFSLCFDLSEEFIKLENPGSIFLNKMCSKHFIDYSGHYNTKGNRLVAESIYQFINKNLTDKLH